MSNDNMLGKPEAKYHTQNLLECSGTTTQLLNLKKKLTVTNSSVGFQIYRLNNELKRLKSIDNEWSNGRKKQIVEEIQELREDVHEEYFHEENGKVFIPAGLWDYVNVTDKSHLNTDIFYVPIEGSREYQAEATKEALKYKRATVVLATGLGKTRVIVAYCMSAIAAGKRVIVIVPSKYLVNQMLETIRQYTDSVTGACSGMIPKLGCDVLVSTVGTAQKHVDNYQVAVVDECHHAAANTWAELLSSSSTLTHVYNLTATPYRGDGLNLGIHAFGGPIVFERDIKWGIQNKWLMPYTAYCSGLKIHDKASEQIVLANSKSSQSAYKTLVDSPECTGVAYDKAMTAIRAGRKVMVLFTTLSPARRFQKLCKAAGYKVSVADANFKKPVDDFRKGTSNLLIATNKLVGEGIDIPNADVLILCTQNSSQSISMQALGRILRLDPEGLKKEPILIDLTVLGFDQFEKAGLTRRLLWSDSANKVIIQGKDWA